MAWHRKNYCVCYTIIVYPIFGTDSHILHKRSAARIKDKCARAQVSHKRPKVFLGDIRALPKGINTLLKLFSQFFIHYYDIGNDPSGYFLYFQPFTPFSPFQ